MPRVAADRTDIPASRPSKMEGDKNAEMLPESRIRLARNDIAETLAPHNRPGITDLTGRRIAKALESIDKALEDLATVRTVLRQKLTG